MRFVAVFIIVIFSFHGVALAQESDTLIVVSAYGKSSVLAGQAGIPMYTGPGSLPIFKDFKRSFDFQSSTFPNMNFQSLSGWKIETGSSIGLLLIGLPVGNNQTGFYGRSARDIFQGNYDMRSYQVNNKLYIGTAGYSCKTFNEYSLKGIFPQTNCSSSLFVGYKFSEKFSISAGFTIQHNGDPLSRNQ